MNNKKIGIRVVITTMALVIVAGSFFGGMKYEDHRISQSIDKAFSPESISDSFSKTFEEASKRTLTDDDVKSYFTDVARQAILDDNESFSEDSISNENITITKSDKSNFEVSYEFDYNQKDGLNTYKETLNVNINENKNILSSKDVPVLDLNIIGCTYNHVVLHNTTVSK